jgi:hypothetical protein
MESAWESRKRKMRRPKIHLFKKRKEKNKDQIKRIT